MKSAIQISLSLLVVFPLVATSCRREPAKDYFEVPLTFTDAGLPVITVTFADAAVPFLVDSGSSQCLIDSATAEVLQLSRIFPNSSSEVGIGGETVKQTHVHDVSFTIENHVFTVQTLMIVDLPGGFSDDFHGILGMTFLRSTLAVIDIEGERLLIQEHTSPRAQSNDNHTMHRTGNRRR